MMKKYKTITLALLILWIVSLLSSSVYYLTETVSMQLAGNSTAASESPVPFLLTIFYFFPLLLLIKRYSNLADMEKINKFARCLTPFYLLFTLIAPIAFLLNFLA